MIDLSNLLKEVKGIDGKIIEIGCWEGKSTICLANTCFPETLICNDTWLGNVQESLITGLIHPTEVILKERDVYSRFIDNMENNMLFKILNSQSNENITITIDLNNNLNNLSIVKVIIYK